MQNIVPQGVMSHRAGGPSGVLFEMQFADTDPWAYPRLPLAETVIPDNRCDGLALTVQVLQGTGTVRVQFIEHREDTLAALRIDSNGWFVQQQQVGAA